MSITARVAGKLRSDRERIASTATEHGVGRAILLGARLVAEGLWWGPARVLDVLLDVRLGGRTRGVVRNESTVRQLSVTGDSNWYEPVQGRKFRAIMAGVRLEPASSSFLDLGAGRGRAMLLAARAGFREIVGVELDPQLAVEATVNVDRWLASRAGRRSGAWLTVRQEDAVETAIPDGPVLVFLYNSFGPVSLRLVLDRMLASHLADPRPMWLCYLNPQHAAVTDAEPALVAQVRRHGWVIYRVDSPTAG